jgi:ribosomal protein L32E
MSRTKKRNRRRATGTHPPPPGAQRIRAPKTRLKPLFALLVEVPMTAEQAVFTTPLPDDDVQRRLMMFDAAMLIRGTNALKSVRLLCEQAHWEFAAGIVRQLFELVINMEHLAEQPDRDAAIFRYAKFGLYQKVTYQYLNLLYDQKTGREIDTQRLAVLRQMLEQTFPEFRRVDEKEKLRIAPSWSGHSARHLAEQSKHRLRADQYELMFAAWSEQTHAAPATLMDNIFPSNRAVDDVVADDDARIAETVTMAITLFLELWMLLPHVPQADPVQRLGWTNSMLEEAQRHGAPSPVPPSDEPDAGA